MQNKFKLNTIVSFIIVFFFLGGVFLFTNLQTGKNSWRYLPEDSNPGFPYGGGGDLTIKAQDQISTLLGEWLEENGGFETYTVNDTKVIVWKYEAYDEISKSYFPPFTTDDAYVAYVDFTIKPKPESSNNWQAGNGEILLDGTVANKSAFLLIDKVDGNYKVLSAATGI